MGSNWIVMKLALLHAHPVLYNVQRTWLAVAALFALMAWQRKLAWPAVWWLIVVTGFFQVTVNFGSTTMALAEGGVGRTAVDMLNFLAWQILVGVLPLTPLPWLMGLAPARWDAEYVGLLAWTAVVSTALGFMLWIEVLRHLPAGTASLNMFAIPVIALVASMIVFGERLTGSEWAGIACIAVGLAILAGRTLMAARSGEQELRPATPTPLDGG